MPAPIGLHADGVPMHYCMRCGAEFFNALERYGEDCPRCREVYRDLWAMAGETRFRIPLTMTAPTIPHAPDCPLGQP